MKKIDKLVLKNFKFFYGENVLNFENNNILLYGENGSAKTTFIRIEESIDFEYMS